MAESDSTVAGVGTSAGGRVSRSASRLFIAVLAALCLAGLVGLLGGRTSSAAAAANGYRLTLSYLHTTRPGLDTYWSLRVAHDGGFKRPVVVAITAAYFDLFETQGFFPTPAETSRDDTYVYLTLTPPPRGDVLELTYDAYLQPYVEPSDLLANPATVAVVRHGHDLARVDFTTWVLP